MILQLLLSLAPTSPSSDALSDAVTARLEPWDRPDGPGGALAVLRGDEVVLARAFGAAELDPDRPMTTRTPVYLASVAKPFTAACTVHAAREGALDLDAALTATFPELPDAYACATLRQCLQHRSGIPDVYDTAILADLGTDVVGSNEHAIGLLGALAPVRSTVRRFVYSNSGYVLAADAVRRKTGSDLGAYAREHLFGPLRMRGASFGERPADAAVSYDRGERGWEPRRLATGLVGPGGMHASLDDLVAFARAWRARAWGDEELWAELLALPDGPRHPSIGGYSLGWMHQRLHGQDVLRHFGGAFGFSADFLRVPALDLTVIALSNASDLDAADVAPAVLELLVPPAPPEDVPTPAEAPDPTAFAGAWRDVLGRVIVLLPRPDGMRLAGLGDLRADLVPAGADAFRAIEAQAPLVVTRTETGLDLVEDGAVLSLERIPPGDRPSADEVVGEYVDDVLGARIRLVPGPEGTVQLEQHDALLSLPPFHPFARDLLLCDRGAALTLQRDEEGRVEGLVADANRAFGLRFRRVR